MADVNDSNADLQRAWLLDQLGISTASAAAVVVDSDQKAAGTGTAVITATATQRAFLDKVIVGGLGSTAGGTAVLTISGASGDDITFPLVVPVGATVALTPTILNFDPPIPGAALGDDITVTLASFGTGNTRADLTAIGHVV